jgi:hypothetical protein
MDARIWAYAGIAIMWVGILVGWLAHLPHLAVTVIIAVGAVMAVVSVIRYRRQNPPR